MEERLARLEAAVSKLDAAASLNDQLSGYYTSIFSGEEIDAAIAKVRSGAVGGVSSFNSRTGAVLPQTGDYTADMVGAAPGGYGLGENPVYIDDANNAVKNGWYSIDNSTLNLPEPSGIWNYCFLKVDCGVRYDQYVVQTVWTGFQIWRGRYVKRCRVAGVWQPWEWVNPPLVLGVEYRTTERYNGKPVYVQTRQFGFVAENTNTSISFASGVDKVLRYSGHATLSPSSYPNEIVALPWNYSETNYIRLSAQRYDNNTIVAFIYSTYLISEAYVQVWYTKTTD